MKTIQFAASAVCALLSASAMADTTDIIATNNQVGIQYISTNVNYTETVNANSSGTSLSTTDTESGNVPGYALNLSVMNNWWLGNDYFKLGYSHNSGDTSGSGTLVYNNANAGSGTGIDSATLEDYFVRYGKGFVTSDNTMITPYFELGHHQWNRSITAGNYSANLNYTNRYYGIGGLAQYTPIKKLTLDIDALVGKNYGTFLNIANAGSGSLTGDNLWRAGIGADYAFTKNFHANIGVDYTSFNYGMSNIYYVSGGSAYFAGAKTNYTTAKIGVGYSF